MSQERELAHASTQQITPTRDDDLAPGRSSLSAKLDAPARPLLSGLIQRKAERDGNGVAEGADSAIATASSSSGVSLPAPIQRKFEASLGTDLSSVRLHTGGESAGAAHAVGAKAYTMGQDIHFGAGQFDPNSAGGEHLLAHEVAHTVQQRGGTPTRQNKLEVSAPQDAAEHEADRAADAMVSGAFASINGFSGLHRKIFREVSPLDTSGGGLSLFAPNTSRSGVPYTVPTVDYKASVKPAAPPLDAEMPSASIPDPGAIPGWKVSIPAQVRQLGPFSYNDPARDVVVSGADHSAEMKDAWDSYKNQLVHDVSSTWDSGAKAKMNSYTQQAHSDPELDQIVKDMHDNYRMTNMGQGAAGKKGTVSDQAGQTNVYNGQTAPDIAGQVAAKGGAMKADLAATANAGQNGTVGGPVGQIVDQIKNARTDTISSATMLTSTQQQLDGAKDSLSAAIASAEIDDLKDKVDDEEKKKKEIENGQASLKKFSPELARLVGIVQDNSDKLKAIGGMVKAGAGAMEGDPSAMLELGKGLLDASKWSALAQCDTNIGIITDQIKTKYKLKNDAALSGATKTIAGLVTAGTAQAVALRSNLLKEKQLHADLAKAVENNWKGKDKADGKLAAQALRAMPIVAKVVRTLQDVKASIPHLPDSSTRASQGFAMATQGVGAPGAAQLLTVGGWIAGSPQAVDADLKKWTDISAQLQTVTAGLGL